MSDRLKALREQRGKIVKQAREIHDKAETEKRALSGEEQAGFDKLMDVELKAVDDKIRGEERLVEEERRNAERVLEGQDRQSRLEHDHPDQAERSKRQMQAFRTFLRSGQVSGDGAEELRELQAGVDTEGGFLVAPQQFVTTLIQAVDDAVFIRNRATKFQVPSAESLGAPSLDTDPDDAAWTTELATGTEDTAMRFGKRELKPSPVAKRIKISKKLLRVSLLPIESIVMQRMAYKFGLTHEKAFLTGNGVDKPLGLFTASASGIPTARDVSTGNTGTAMTFDGLIEAKYSVKSQYWPRGDWLFHRDGVKQIVKLKDGDGQYIWRMSVRDGEPDILLGRPMLTSEYVPNTFTSGLYVGLFGDLSYYWIADALDMQVQRLVELYAETNQDGFIGRMESDGQPVLAEAFARVKLA